MNLNCSRSVEESLIYKTRDLAKRSLVEIEILSACRHTDIYTCRGHNDL